MSPAPVVFSKRADQTAEQMISYFMQQAVENPDLISLAAGLVDPISLPGSEVLETIQEILGEPASARAALQYGTTQGYTPLREALLKRTFALDGVSPEDLSLTPGNVVITTGSQQFLYLVGEMLLDPGDLVITEAPSYFVFQGTLSSLGVNTLAVPMDEEGMRTDLLEELLDRLEHTGEINRLKMIYVVDYFQNPSGLTLSLKRRQHLMELVQKYSTKHRIMILEDAAYRELRYDGDDLPSIKSLDADNQYVISTMTFSKPCSPGLKTGYGFLPHEMVDPLLRFKGNHDFGSNNLTQHLLLRLLQTGAYDRHVQDLQSVYRKKRDTMLSALEETFGTDGNDSSTLHWTHPKGGLYVWAAFPKEVNTGAHGKLIKAALHEGVLYVPGQFCYVYGAQDKLPTNEARLSFGVAQPDQIREGIFRLGKAVKAVHPGLVPEPVATI